MFLSIFNFHNFHLVESKIQHSANNISLFLVWPLLSLSAEQLYFQWQCDNSLFTSSWMQDMASKRSFRRGYSKRTSFRQWFRQTIIRRCRQLSGLLGFQTLSIVQYSYEHDILENWICFNRQMMGSIRNS